MEMGVATSGAAIGRLTRLNLLRCHAPGLLCCHSRVRRAILLKNRPRLDCNQAEQPCTERENLNLEASAYTSTMYIQKFG